VATTSNTGGGRILSSLRGSRGETLLFAGPLESSGVSEERSVRVGKAIKRASEEKV
jgi:hypothetical protein